MIPGHYYYMYVEYHAHIWRNSFFKPSHAHPCELISPLRQTKSTGRLTLVADNHMYIKASGVRLHIHCTISDYDSFSTPAWHAMGVLAVSYVVAIESRILLITHA
jgi:hypothetical protein